MNSLQALLSFSPPDVSPGEFLRLLRRQLIFAEENRWLKSVDLISRFKSSRVISNLNGSSYEKVVWHMVNPVFQEAFKPPDSLWNLEARKVRRTAAEIRLNINIDHPLFVSALTSAGPEGFHAPAFFFDLSRAFGQYLDSIPGGFASLGLGSHALPPTYSLHRGGIKFYIPYGSLGLFGGESSLAEMLATWSAFRDGFSEFLTHYLEGFIDA